MNTAVSTTPYHNCIQVTLENNYFKEKLKQFYVENKSLKEKLSQLELQLNKKKQNEADNDKVDKSKNINDEDIQNDATNRDKFKSKIPIRNERLSKSPIVQTTSNLVENKNNINKNNKIESTRCTVCTYNTNRIKLENDTTSNCNCVCNNKQFDSDIYNQQNKVNSFIY
jgi:hypothetical protein